MKSIIVILCFSLMHVLSAKEHGEEPESVKVF